MPPCRMQHGPHRTGANPYQVARKFDSAACGSMWTSTPTGCHAINQPNKSIEVQTDDAVCGPTPQGTVFDGAMCGPMWASAPTGCIRINHPGIYTPGGAEGPLALSPQQCEAWIEGVPALLSAHRTKPPNKPQTLKVLLDFFQKIAGVQGAAPPVAPRKARNTPYRPPYRIRSPAPSSPRKP